MAVTQRVTLSQEEAAYNVALFEAHEREHERKKIPLAVYRSRTFIALTEATPWFERLKCYIQWVLGIITYEPEAVTQLAKLSKSQWYPQREIDAKIQQLEEAQQLLEKAQLEIQLKAVQLQEAEQELQIFRHSSNNWMDANKNAQEIQEKYHTLFKETQTREEEKNKKIMELMNEVTKFANLSRDKQMKIEDLEKEIIKVRREVRISTDTRVPSTYQAKVYSPSGRSPASPFKPND